MARLVSVAVSLLAAQAQADKMSAPLTSAQLTASLNSDFTAGGASGAILRQALHWELWCGKGCYKGRPDCMTSASIWNSKIGVDPDGRFYGRNPFADGAGIVFNLTLVNQELGKCFYVYDGGVTDRYNGGCGCEASKADMNCKSSTSPFQNHLPDGSGQMAYGDTDFGKKCLCKDPQLDPSIDGHACVWRGPAFQESADSFFGKSELAEMVVQREKFNLNADDIAHRRTGKNYTEVLIDSHRLDLSMTRDPAATVLGLYYNHPGMPWQNPKASAQTIQKEIQALYGVKLPLVRVNIGAVVSEQQGPFSEDEPAPKPQPTPTPTPKPTPPAPPAVSHCHWGECGGHVWMDGAMRARHSALSATHTGAQDCRQTSR